MSRMGLFFVACLACAQAVYAVEWRFDADASQLDWQALIRERASDGPVRLVANLPFSVATPLLRSLLDLREELVDWSIMLQREVAQR
ncbi:MAG: hypothetical protein ACE1Y4_07720, partial [Lysobacterales bacterium]